MAASEAVSRALISKTVHITIWPTPRTFPQRREVLRVLERYGEVMMFRSLKYEKRKPIPHSCLCLFSKQSAADAAIDDSPIRYRLITEVEDPKSQPLNFFSETSSEPAELNPKPEELTFQLYLKPAVFDHINYLESYLTNPLHGPWKPLPPKKSFIGASLDRIVPKSISRLGLLDWETEKLGMRSEHCLDRDDLPGGRSLEGTWKFLNNGRKFQRITQGLPDVMEGLKDLKERKLKDERDEGVRI